MEELLLAACPGKFLPAVAASACLIFKLTHFLLPFFGLARGGYLFAGFN